MTVSVDTQMIRLFPQSGLRGPMKVLRHVGINESLLAQHSLLVAMMAIRVLEQAHVKSTAKKRRRRKTESLCDSCGAPRARKR